MKFLVSKVIQKKSIFFRVSDMLYCSKLFFFCPAPFGFAVSSVLVC
jgi:hypothetical protein